MGLLPHRYPFALVDRVIEHLPGKKAVAIKNVTLNEPQFQHPKIDFNSIDNPNVGSFDIFLKKNKHS